jgi:hypothetical protein
MTVLRRFPQPECGALCRKSPKVGPLGADDVRGHEVSGAAPKSKNVPELVVSEPLMIAQLGALLLFQPATEVE